MKKIFLFEPSIGSENIGDQIIVDSVKREMGQLLDSAFYVELPTHLPLSNRYMYFLGKPDMKFVCGSNIVVGDLNPIIHLKQWCISPLTAPNLKGAVLIGVGARNYQLKVTALTKWTYRLLFKGDTLHSVRDSYTEEQMHKIGIPNVINTGCPTMWSLTPSHCQSIPKGKARKAVCTLTDYSPVPKRDEQLLNVLKNEYEDVYFWPQGHRDYAYFQTLGNKDGIKVVNPHLKDYDDFLKDNDTDFVGTRLHGGIRALQHARRTIIIGIDNRALELNRDFNLPVLPESEIDKLPEMIRGEWSTDIHLPIENIKKFLSQFSIEYHA